MNAKKTTRRKRGAVQVEYAFLLVFVVVPAAAAVFATGSTLYGRYKTARTAILSSNP